MLGKGMALHGDADSGKRVSVPGNGHCQMLLAGLRQGRACGLDLVAEGGWGVFICLARPCPGRIFSAVLCS